MCYTRVKGAIEDYLKEETEEKQFEILLGRWLALLPHMVVNTTGGKKAPLKFVPLHDYLKEIKNPSKKSDKTPEEILSRMSKIIEYNKKKRGG